MLLLLWTIEFLPFLFSFFPRFSHPLMLYMCFFCARCVSFNCHRTHNFIRKHEQFMGFITLCGKYIDNSWNKSNSRRKKNKRAEMLHINNTIFHFFFFRLCFFFEFLLSFWPFVSCVWTACQFIYVILNPVCFYNVYMCIFFFSFGFISLAYNAYTCTEESILIQINIKQCELWFASFG